MIFLYKILGLVVVGAIFGSFMNMLIYRLPRKVDMVFKRSFCPSCEHVLGLRDLVPLFGYLFNLGRCRFCKTNIPIRYLFCEILSIVILIFAFENYGLSFCWQHTY